LDSIPARAGKSARHTGALRSKPGWREILDAFIITANMGGGSRPAIGIAAIDGTTNWSTWVTYPLRSQSLLQSPLRLGVVRDHAIVSGHTGRWRARPGRRRKNLLRALLFAAWMPFSAPVASEWQRLIENETAVYYIDPATAAWSGSVVRIWTLSDNKPAPLSAPPESRSTKTHWEIDCAHKRLRVLLNASHAQPMGAGERAFASSGPPGGYPWISPRPGEINEPIVRRACARK